MNFVHLHTHSEYSMLDGLSSIDEYVTKATKMKQPALALTDHGSLMGLSEFYHKCRKAELEPILGSEFYFVPDAAHRPAKGEKQDERYHVVILGRGEAGYKTLVELSTESHRNFHYKPLIDRKVCEALGDDARNLVVLSGCAASIISKMALGEVDGDAEEWTIWWRETFPNFYIELQHHDTAFDIKLNRQLLKIAKKFKIPWVVTNDPHYAFKKDSHHHDVLLALQTASNIDDPNRFKFDGHGYHMRSRKEMEKAFRIYKGNVFRQGAKTTLEIAKDCKTRVKAWEKRSWMIPKYPDTEDAYVHIKKLCRKEMKRREWDEDEAYTKRLKEELRVIKKMNVSDFLMITKDTIDYAKIHNIPVGPGRGSVCGSLVCFLIGIHKIDPVRYNLLFERFLNPARPRMPDIDVDFSQTRRTELFDYVTEKYGRENVIHVCTYGRMRAKAAFQQLAKAHGISFADSIRISKELEDADDIILPKEITDNYPDLAAQLNRLAGTKRSVGMHPGGVIIADPKTHIRRLVPEMWIPKTKRWVGQYDLEAIEEMGLLKQDMLGLRTLDTVDECLKLIKESTGEEVDPDSWVPDQEPNDKKVYKMLAQGFTAGVFQMEGGTNTRGIVEIKPKEFEDVVSCTSVYRTGPIIAGFPQQFLENRIKGVDNIKYLSPKLRPILEETWGVILYQEQVMEIAKQLAGFDMALVDDIKEAIKHKKSTLMVSLRPTFIEGCHNHSGIKESVAGKIWDQIEGYSGYSYNRSHAVAYTFLTYQTARLKYLYPLQFITALLRTVDKDSKNNKRETYLTEAIRLGYKVLPPCVNRSGLGASPDLRSGGIRLGLTDCKGIGPKMAERILEGRPKKGYKDIGQVIEAVNNKKVLQILEHTYALKQLGLKGNTRKSEEILGWILKDRMINIRKEYEDDVVLPEGGKSNVLVVGEIAEIVKSTTKNGDPFCTWKVRWSPTHVYTVKLWDGTQRLWHYPLRTVVAVHGKWELKWQNISVGNTDQVKVLYRVKVKNKRT